MKTYVAKFTRNDEFLIFKNSYDEVTKTFSDTIEASSDSVREMWDSFLLREQNEEWGPKGDFLADIDGLEDEAKFIREPRIVVES
jgi:hypothetical protein